MADESDSGLGLEQEVKQEQLPAIHNPGEEGDSKTEAKVADDQKQDELTAKAKNEDTKDQSKDAKEDQPHQGDENEPKAEEKQPAGGHDPTPVPPLRQPGYTVKFTFHRATNLPMADITTLSSDPYVFALLTTDVKSRHKEDPGLVFRTHTVLKNTDPEWNSTWIVANVPASGFRLKARIIDQDPKDHDDRLGNVHIDVDHISLASDAGKGKGKEKERREDPASPTSPTTLGPTSSPPNGSTLHPSTTTPKSNPSPPIPTQPPTSRTGPFKNIINTPYKIKKRSGSWRAYFVRFVHKTLTRDWEGLSGSLYVSVEVLGRTEGESDKLYTVGPGHWSQHFSPIVGKITGTKEPKDADGKGPEKYDFQANQIQLAGPVPDELYHRYVEFKPFVKGMFSKTGLRGHILNRLLHYQHDRIYSHDARTKYGVVPEPGKELAEHFLKTVHYDEGGRLFTYVLMLDGQLRFTETGKNFGIDLLSKHTMHSDVSQYIACSGEFFVRRLEKLADDHEAPEEERAHPPEPVEGGPPEKTPPTDPRFYELIIDNDSGTYRPNGDLMPLFQKYLDYNFSGLKVIAMVCDDPTLSKMKEDQKKTRENEGDAGMFVQGDADSSESISSSDEERLEAHAKKTGDGTANGEARRREKMREGGKKAKRRAGDPKMAVMEWADKKA